MKAKRVVRALMRRLPASVQLKILQGVERARRDCINPLLKKYRYKAYLRTQVAGSAYSRQHPRARSGTEHSIGVILKHLTPPALVFDAGCGDGFALDLLRERGLAYVGGDINEAKLEEARRYGHADVRRMDLHTLDLDASSVDAIHCSHVLEHLLDARSVVNEFGRVLKKRGLLMIVVPIGPSNERHPTAFLTDADLERLVPSQWEVLERGRGIARGGEELWTLYRV